MSVQVEKLENGMAKLTIEVPAEEIEKAAEKVYQKQKGSITIPGFRKGKATRQMVEKIYGKRYLVGHFLKNDIEICVFPVNVYT